MVSHPNAILYFPHVPFVKKSGFVLAGQNSKFFLAKAPVRPTPSRRRDKYNELTEAPESGYRQQLEITPSQKDSVFFYCRFGEYYGKGQLYRPFLSKVRGTPFVYAPVVIYLSPVTGSRHLRTHM